MEKININKVTLSYETVGEGSDILLLHGFPSNMFMWEKIKTHLVKNGYRVTIVEQRGYPLSRLDNSCLLYTSPSPRDLSTSRMPSSA